MSTLIFVLDVILLLLFILTLYVVITTKKINVGAILYLIFAPIILLDDFFNIIKEDQIMGAIVCVTLIIYWFCKLLAIIYKKLTGDTEDYNNFIKWFG